MISVNTPLIKTKPRISKKWRKWLCIIALLLSTVCLLILLVFLALILPTVRDSANNFSALINSLKIQDSSDVNNIIKQISNVLDEINTQTPLINALINSLTSNSASIEYMLPRVSNIIDNVVPTTSSIQNNIEPIIQQYYGFVQNSNQVLTLGEELINTSLNVEYPMINETLEDVRELVDEIRHYINSTLT